ncbi:M20/M25/M40 family metallo-hydrolase [Neokomagataea thailandica]|nr:M20/M25/M40 family metallo-hydrolase [Neokomagataea thailandica]
MLRTKPMPAMTVRLNVPNGSRSLVQFKDLCLFTVHPENHQSLDHAQLVFVGYGVHAPERGWDDFKGVDLKGKIAVILINDPDFDASAGEAVAGKFGGRAMTYYGRWTYKYEEAAQRGAAAAIIVHDTPGASYPWATVIAPGAEEYALEDQGDKEAPPIAGWIQGDAAAALFKSAGQDLTALRVKARSPDFRPVPLDGVSLTVDMPVAVSHLVSQNVIGKIVGKTRPNDSILVGAHWDAFGESQDAAGHTIIRRGANDDGAGIAAVLEVARAFVTGPRPDRTLVFAAWTGEERGLLGSSWYAAHPLFPIATTVANVTFDVLQTAGPARNAFIVGAGQDQLQDAFAAAAKMQGRTTSPEAEPERGAFYRADHLPFARLGVPVLPIMGMSGDYDLVNGGVAAGARWAAGYRRCYHQPCDAWSQTWDLRGAAQDIAAAWAVVHHLAFSDTWPGWSAGSEFAAIRASSNASRR